MKLSTIAVLLGLAVLTAGCSKGGQAGSGQTGSGGSQTKTKQVILKVADVWSATHPIAAAVDEIFKPAVEKESNGAIKVEVYHDGVLGSEKEIWDSVRNGTVEMAVIGSVMNTEYTTMLISDWPFLYRDITHAKNVWTGPVAEDINAEFHQKFPTVYVLGWGPNSARTFTSNKKLTSVDDFKGQKFRMPSNPVHVGIAENLGASAQVIPLGDLFSALETGVVDGQDNGMVTVRSQTFYEVQKYLYETNHIVATMELIVSAPFLDGLSPEHQTIVKTAAKTASATAWDNYIKSIDQDREFLKEKGMTITPLAPEDQARMIELIKPVTDKLFADNPWAAPLVEKIRNQ
ncbi:MAG: TRAP transporter substrate-binding protein [Spirochaetaceae bacterium]|nr:TRAP transporter substrate-binding protein [Spirochaetaceae bacterium]